MVLGAFSSVSEVSSCLGQKIIIDAEGNRTIAASRRSDGSYRKERRIRPGYIHDDERQRFITKGTLFRQRVQEAEKNLSYFEEPTSVCKKKTNTQKKKKKKNVTTHEEEPPIVLPTEVFAPSIVSSHKLTDISVPELHEQEQNTVGTKNFTEKLLNKQIQALKSNLKTISEIEKKIALNPIKVTQQQHQLVQKKTEFLDQLQELQKNFDDASL